MCKGTGRRRPVGSDASPLVISKIKSVSELKHFNIILKERNRIMVTQRDMRVKISIQKVINV